MAPVVPAADLPVARSLVPPVGPSAVPSVGPRLVRPVGEVCGAPDADTANGRGRGERAVSAALARPRSRGARWQVVRAGSGAPAVPPYPHSVGTGQDVP